MIGCSARHWTILFIHSTHYSHRSPQQRNTITSENAHTTDNCQHTVDTYLIETLWHEYCINTLTENTIVCYCTQTVSLTLIVVLINCVLSVSNNEYDDDDTICNHKWFNFYFPKTLRSLKIRNFGDINFFSAPTCAHNIRTKGPPLDPIFKTRVLKKWTQNPLTLFRSQDL